MHRTLPPASEMLRPCVFCDNPVIQAKGRIATNRKAGYGKTGMAHEECWAYDKRTEEELGNATVSDTETD